ncbi:MAG: hypothetical protein ACI4M8_04120 [Christensenellales bacterium]
MNLTLSVRLADNFLPSLSATQTLTEGNFAFRNLPTVSSGTPRIALSAHLNPLGRTA